MISRCPRLLYTRDQQQLSDQLALKVGSLVGVNPLWEAVETEVSIPELTSNLLRCLIVTWESVSHFCEMVSDDQDIYSVSIWNFG